MTPTIFNLKPLLDDPDIVALVALSVERPTLQTQEVDDRVARVSEVTVDLHRGVAGALGELLLVGAEHERQVSELRRLEAEGLWVESLLELNLRESARVTSGDTAGG